MESTFDHAVRGHGFYTKLFLSFVWFFYFKLSNITCIILFTRKTFTFPSQQRELGIPPGWFYLGNKTVSFVEFIGISVILPSPSVSSFFIKASHFFLLIAWLILPSSAVVMKPELSLSIACRHGEFFYQRETSSLHTHLECEDGSVEVLRLSLLINVLLQHLRPPIILSRGGNRRIKCSPLCKVKEGVFLNESRFVCDSV